MTDESNYVIGFIDNELDFLETVEEKATERDLKIVHTSNPNECLTWAQQGKIGILFADLRMPQENGLALLKKVHQLNTIRINILTGFRPTTEEKHAAQSMGAPIFDKKFLTDILDDLKALEVVDLPSPDEEMGAAIGASTPTTTGSSDKLISETQGMLLDWLRSRKDQESKSIYFEGRSYSTTDLINEIQARTPVGEAHLVLFTKVLRKMMR